MSLMDSVKRVPTGVPRECDNERCTNQYIPRTAFNVYCSAACRSAVAGLRHYLSHRKSDQPYRGRKALDYSTTQLPQYEASLPPQGMPSILRIQELEAQARTMQQKFWALERELYDVKAARRVEIDETHRKAYELGYQSGRAAGVAEAKPAYVAQPLVPRVVVQPAQPVVKKSAIANKLETGRTYTILDRVAKRPQGERTKVEIHSNGASSMSDNGSW